MKQFRSFVLPQLKHTQTQTHAHKAGINPDTSDMCFFPSFPLSSTGFSSRLLSVGGGEDYRQNPAESHQSTEGELQFYGHVAPLAPWLPCDSLSPTLGLLLLCSLNSGCAALHNVIRCSQQRPQGTFNLGPPRSSLRQVVVGSG